MSALIVAAASDIGLVRTDNEDSFLVGERIWAVADGMGGQAAGRTASQIAIAGLERYDSAGVIDQVGLAALIDTLSDDIVAYGLEHPQDSGLGTTLAGVAQVDLAGQQHWLVFHVGDSRVYRLSDQRLIQETTDHSHIQVLIDQGVVTADEARTHPQRHVLTRCLGGSQPPRPDIRLVPCIDGDRLLVCSDGLTAEIDDASIEHILRSSASPCNAVDGLITTALSLGGRDNVTVVVIEVVSEEDDRGDELVEDTLPGVWNEGDK